MRKSAHAVSRAVDATAGRLLRGVLIGLIVGYRRLLSPMLGPRCRYYPSCSAYGLEAVRTHGAFKGTALTTARIVRCNPWSAGGVDPVPEKGTWRPTPYVSLEDHADLRAALAANGSAPAGPVVATTAPATFDDDRSSSWT